MSDQLSDRKREADHQKEVGNKHFKSGHIDESIKCYTNAIQLDAKNIVFFCNRAMAYLKKDLPLEAHKDCDSALDLDNKCVKALYRRGLSRRQLFRYRQAMDDFRQVLALDVDNNDARRELAAIERLIASKQVVDIKAVDKSPELQSKKQLTKVCISSKNSLNVTVNELAIKLPDKLPQTYYQFECDWRQLIGPNCQQLRLNYLEMIGSRDGIREALSSALEPQMMSDLLATVCHSNDSQLIYNVLHRMSKTPRFDTIVLFLSQLDHLNLNQIIDKLKQNNFDEKLIADIKANFL